MTHLQSPQSSTIATYSNLRLFNLPLHLPVLHPFWFLIMIWAFKYHGVFVSLSGYLIKWKLFSFSYGQSLYRLSCLNVWIFFSRCAIKMGALHQRRLWVNYLFLNIYLIVYRFIKLSVPFEYSNDFVDWVNFSAHFFLLRVPAWCGFSWAKIAENLDCQSSQRKMVQERNCLPFDIDGIFWVSRPVSCSLFLNARLQANRLSEVSRTMPKGFLSAQGLG